MAKDLELRRIELAALRYGRGWARTGDWTAEPEFNELVDSIENIGQRDPIGVREIVWASGFYEVIYGFRRAAALQYLMHRNGTDGDILALVYDCTDAEVLEMRMIASTTSQPLAPSDLCALLTQLAQCSRESGVNLSDSQLANRIGLSQSYCNTLLRIGRNAPALVQHWRNDRRPLSTSDVRSIAMKVSDPEEQLRWYNAIGALPGNIVRHWLSNDDRLPIEKLEKLLQDEQKNLMERYRSIIAVHKALQIGVSVNTKGGV